MVNASEAFDRAKKKAAAHKAKREVIATTKKRKEELKALPEYKDYWPVIEQAVAFFDKAIEDDADLDVTSTYHGFAFTLHFKNDELVIRIVPPAINRRDHLAKLRELCSKIQPELTAMGVTAKNEPANAIFYLHPNG